MPTSDHRLDDCIAYRGLISHSKTDADIRKGALASHVDPDDLIARVTQLRAASHRLVKARLDYVEQTRADFALLKGVADADAGYADRRVGSTEMDIFLIANRVTEG